MTFRAFLTALVLATAALAVQAADEANPYKNAKVGDYAKYTVVTKFGDFKADGTFTQTVTAKSDKEATIKITGSMDVGGKRQEFPAREQKIDLTQPLNPTNGANLPGGAPTQVEKGKEGKEILIVNGKQYDCTWTTYKVKTKAMGQEVDSEVKAWMAKEVPSGLVKMTATSEVGGKKIELTTELKETGKKQ